MFFAVGELIIIGRHANEQTLHAVRDAQSEMVDERLGVGEVELAVEGFQHALLICVFDCQCEFSLRVFAADVAHGNRPVDFIAFAQAARHAHFGRELFARGDFVVERARVELHVVGESIELPLRQTCGQGETKRGQAVFVGAQRRHEKGCLRKVGTHRHRCLFLDFQERGAGGRGGSVHGFSFKSDAAVVFCYSQRGGTDKHHLLTQHHLVTPIVEHGVVPMGELHRGNIEETLTGQMALERRQIPKRTKEVGRREVAQEIVVELPRRFVFARFLAMLLLSHQRIERSVVESRHHVGFGRFSVRVGHGECPRFFLSRGEL